MYNYDTKTPISTATEPMIAYTTLKVDSCLAEREVTGLDLVVAPPLP